MAILKWLKTFKLLTTKEIQDGKWLVLTTEKGRKYIADL